MLAALESEGLAVRCLVRKRNQHPRKEGKHAEYVNGDVLRPETLDGALRGIEVAYYFVHSMAGGNDFQKEDKKAAHNFGAACARQNVKRIIYLGALADSGLQLSAHLRSRQEVGEILRSYPAQVIEFRASVVLGAGSLSFEMIRALVERLRVLIFPKWVSVKAQPIAIRDALSYLRAAMDMPGTDSRIYEIGGADRVSYGDLMREYARQRGLRRWFVRVSVLTPRLSSLWLGLVTPVYARVGRILIDSIRHETVVKDDRASRDFDVRPVGMRAAIEEAVRDEDRMYTTSTWSSLLSPNSKQRNSQLRRAGNLLFDYREALVNAPPHVAFATIRRIGGKTGWYYGDRLWALRGMMDSMLGGVGHRRSRRDPDNLEVGDAVDFWRVEAFEPDRRVRLAAEMKVPGRAWLEFEVAPHNSGSVVRQSAVFQPFGTFGRLYWLALSPVHGFIFAGMLRNICRRIEQG